MSTSSVCTSTKPKNKPQAREVIDSFLLSTLIGAYNVHFEEYSRTRKQVSQTIPAVVWRKVYDTFINVHPEAIKFNEENLKDRVRQTLRELKTGTSNQKGTAVVQSTEILGQIRLTDSHASRNVLSLRNSILMGDSAQSPPTTPKRSPSPARIDHPVSSSASQDVRSEPPVKKSRLSKAKMLERQVHTIDKIQKTLASSADKRAKLIDAKIRSHELATLKELRELGILSDEEFKEKVRTLISQN